MTTIEYILQRKMNSIGERMKDRNASSDDINAMLDCVRYVKELYHNKDESDDTNKLPDDDYDHKDIRSWLKIERNVDNEELYKRYMMEIEKDPKYIEEQNRLAIMDLDTCCRCKKSMLYTDYYRVCPGCGFEEDHTETSNCISYGQDTFQIVHQYSYKRSNHFNEWLNKIQAKQNAGLPPEIIPSICAEIKKQRLVKIDHVIVRGIMKKLNFNKYYDHMFYITSQITKVKPPTFPPPLEEKLKDMFCMIQEPWSRVKPSDRSNFFSYGYILYKFCELLGEDSYLHFFALLKSESKLHNQDKIWEKVCQDLNWEFIDTNRLSFKHKRFF